jgi:hypothetical protein
LCQFILTWNPFSPNTGNNAAAELDCLADAQRRPHDSQRGMQVSHHLDTVNLQHGSTSSCSLATSLTLLESNTGFRCACLLLMSCTVHRILHIQPGHEPMLRWCNLKPWHTVKLGQGHHPWPINACTSHGLSTGPTSRGWYVRTHIRQSVALL